MTVAVVVRVYGFRDSEYRYIGTYIRDRFKEDVGDFAEYTDFADPFLDKYSKELDGLELIVFPINITNELSVVTERMYTNVFGIRPLIDRIANFALNAGSTLNVKVRDFGVQAVRDAINSSDVQDLDNALHKLDTNITNNLTALQAKGFKVVIQTDLAKLKKAIFDDNLEQARLLDKRANLVTNNLGLLNSIYTDYINKVVVQAKNIYRNTNKEKVAAYTYSKIIAKIRHDAAKTLASGKVLDKDGNAIAGAKVVFKPLGGGRSKTVKTDKDGNYEAAGIAPNDYTVLVSTKNGLSKVVSFGIGSAEHKTLDIILN